MTKLAPGTKQSEVGAAFKYHDFAIAEEVTLKGGYERRADLVLYVNGIVIGFIELKGDIVRHVQWTS
jgi:type I restriction enzyme, R subunit